MFSDLRVGLRLLWKDKAFTATAGLTLAVCIGANTALFSVVRGVLLKPLGFPEADRVVMAGNMYPGAGVHEAIGAAVPDYFDRLREVTVFVDQALFRQGDRSVDRGGTPASVKGMAVTPSFFRVAGVEPQLGRTFTKQEGEIGNDHVVVISDSFWRTQFAGDSAAVGRDLRIDGRAHTVVGVMPPDFPPTDDDIDLWTPMTFTAEQKSDDSRHSNNAAYVARLKPGATVQQAQAQIDALNAANLDRFPQFKEVIINAGFRTVVIRLQNQMVRDVRATLYLMWGGALVVLLIGCVNVANLALVRSRARLKELATRLALGAGAWRITRQLVVEHLLLAAGAAVAGIAIDYAALFSMDAVNLQELPRSHDIALNAVVVTYTLAAAAVIGLVLGLIPVAAMPSANVLGVLREEGRTATTGRGARSLRRALVIAQVGCAFVVLIGAGGDAASLSGALRREVAAIDSQLPVFEMQPMSYWTDRSLAKRRAPALLSIAFGFVALFLSAVGIYGVLAYLVTQRTKEIGIRVALGSTAWAVFQLVLREGFLLVAAGLVLGGVGSFMLRRTLESQLFGVTSSNPFVLFLVSALLATVALAACAVPARRATKIDPLVALTE